MLMANDPERPIEKALRAEARRRREQAGPAFELHPANRRLLQAEVTRQFGNTDTRTSSFLASWLRLWPGLGWSVATLVGLGTAALLMLPSTTRQQKPQMLANRSGEEELAKAKAPLLADNASAQNQEKAAQQPARDLAAAAVSENAPVKRRDELEQTTTTAAAPPPPASVPAETSALASNPLVLEPQATLAQRSPGQVESESLGGAAAPSTTLRAMPSLAANRPAFSDGLAKDKAMANQRFVQVPSPEASAGALADAGSSAPAVLASFDVEQAGLQLLVVDSDGSVYKGGLETPPNGQAQLQLQQGAAPESRALKTRSTKSEVNLQLIAPTETAYYFRVEGTNVSSKQRVVFKGKLLPGTNPPASALTRNGPSDGSRNIAALTNAAVLLLRDARIQGQAAVGDRPPISIKAVPAGQP